MKSVIFCWLTEVTLCHFSCGQKPSHVRSHSTRRKIMMICFKWIVSSFAVSLKSLYPFIPESNRKSPNTSFFMRTKRKPPEVAFKATKDDDDLFQKKSVIFCWLTEVTLCHFSCGQKPSHLRSHSTRRKMMMICFKWRVSSFAVSLKSLYPFIPETNRNSPNTSFFRRTKRKPPEVAFKATKDDDDLFEKKSVIFCWLTEIDIPLSLHPGNQPQVLKHVIFHADKNLATWGRIQRDERWRWSISKLSLIHIWRCRRS